MSRSHTRLGLIAIAGLAACLIGSSPGHVIAMPMSGGISSEQILSEQTLPNATDEMLSLVARRSPWIYPRHGGHMGGYYGGHRNYGGIYRPRYGYGGRHWAYNGRHYHGGHYYGYNHHHHYNDNYYWPGYGIGLLWGLGSGLYYGGYGWGGPYYGAGYYGGGYYGAQDAHQAWCFRRYRSYDPASDTFMGYDGYRHYCRGPY